MQRIRVYAHWLDPEYLGYRWPDAQVAARRLELLGLLKMRAILGDTLCLSDVQLNDSRLVFELFSDPEFQAFVERDREFLRLVSRPTDKFSATSEKLPIIESGFGRVVPGWNSSTFPSPAIHLTLADHLQKERPHDEAHFLHIFRHNGSKIDEILSGCGSTDKMLVRGMVQAMEYFCLHTDQVELCNLPPASYYDVLQSAESSICSEATDSQKRLQTELQDVLTFVDSSARGSDRHRRTPAIVKLAVQGIQKPENFNRYANILQAWNICVARSVSPTHQSGYYLPVAVPFTFLFGKVSELSFAAEGSDDELFKYSERQRWHPSGLSWATVGFVRDECRAKILAYQGEPQNPSRWDDLLKAIANAVVMHGEGVRPGGRPSYEQSRRSPPWVTGGPEAGERGGVLGSVSEWTSKVADATEQYWMLPEFAVLVAWCLNSPGTAASFGLMPILAGLHNRVMPLFRKQATYDALDRYAIRYNLRVEQAGATDE